METVEKKLVVLQRYLQELQSIIVAYSGGIDSALLLKIAGDVLGDRVLAITADSPSVPRQELQEAREFAARVGVRHLIVATEEFDQEDYTSNPSNRCYFCKFELYSKLQEIARQEKIRYVANGTNMDDLGDYRPGLQAADEFEVVSPLQHAGLTKSDIRALAKRLDLEIWDKPASPCLSSRIPYGDEVTPEKLAMIEAAEIYLRSLGIRELRVRHFAHKARIETALKDIPLINKKLKQIEKRFLQIGFSEVELAEFRSGALNTFLHIES
jgi:uncharacterized protein